MGRVPLRGFQIVGERTIDFAHQAAGLAGHRGGFGLASRAAASAMIEGSRRRDGLLDGEHYHPRLVEGIGFGEGDLPYLGHQLGCRQAPFGAGALGEGPDPVCCRKEARMALEHQRLERVQVDRHSEDRLVRFPRLPHVPHRTPLGSHLGIGHAGRLLNVVQRFRLFGRRDRLNCSVGGRLAARMLRWVVTDRHADDAATATIASGTAITSIERSHGGYEVRDPARARRRSLLGRPLPKRDTHSTAKAQLLSRLAPMA